MAIQIKLKNSVVQDSTPSTSDLPAVGEIALNANINSIGGFMRASDNSIVKIFGPGSLSTPTATTTVSGISELATNSETTTGTATNRVVTPAGLNAVTVAERSTSNSTYLALAGGTLTGVVAATAGSNSAPSIHFGDSDSGIFGGTNTVSLAAGGTTRLTADTGVSVVGTLAVTGAITSTSDLTIPDKIIHSGDTNTAIRFPAADTVSVETGGSEAIRINDSGQFLIGVSSARTMFTGYTPSLQVEGNAKSDSASSLVVNNASTVGPTLWFGKTRGTSLGSNTVVQSGDELGTIFFNGADGTDVQSIAASIRSEVDGTPGSNDMPGRLVFSTTADGAASPTERLRIDNAGLVKIPDDGKVVAGAGNDLQIYHNGSNSLIEDTGTGNLEIKTNGTKVTLQGGTEAMINAIKDGAVELYHNASKKFETTTDGATVSGKIFINAQNPNIRLDDSDTSNNGEITLDNTSLRIECDEDNAVSSSLIKFRIDGSEKATIDASGSVTATTFVGNIDAVDGDFDGTLEADAITVGGVALNTVIAGVTVTNATNATNAANITAADESSDTTCFPVFVTAATGNLAPKTGSNLSFNSSSGRLTATSFAGDGSNLTGVGGDVVDDTSPQLGGNLDVNSKNIVFGDSSGETNNRLTFGNATDGDLRIYHDSANSYIQDTGTGELRILTNQLVVGNPAFTENLLTATQDGSVALFHNGTKKLETASFGLRSSDSLYVDEHILIDNDTGIIKLGTSADLQIYHDGSHSRIVDSGTGHLLIQGSQVKIMNAAASENMIRAEENGSVELYQNNNLKLSTVSDGIIVHGGTNVSMDNDGNGQIRIIGNGYSGGIALNASGMNIYHNSTSRSLIFGVNESEVARFDTDGHFRPSANNTRDLGTSSTRWRNIYTNDLNLSNEGGANDVDGTWGSYTIQEGAEDLFLVNKRSGKKYKFNLTEVS